MSEWIGPILLGLGGMVLGLFHFGLLWLTVRGLPSSSHAPILAGGSLLVRMAVTVWLFYLVARTGRWEAVLALLTGFVLVRIVLVRRFGLKERLVASERAKGTPRASDRRKER
jgi:F1F0 ATPase subunit 2